MVEPMNRLFEDYLFAGLGPERWLEEFLRSADPGFALRDEDEIALALSVTPLLPQAPDLEALLAPITGGQPAQRDPAGGRAPARQTIRRENGTAGSAGLETNWPHRLPSEDTLNDQPRSHSGAGEGAARSWRSNTTALPVAKESVLRSTGISPTAPLSKRRTQAAGEAHSQPRLDGMPDPRPASRAMPSTGELIERWAATAAQQLSRAWRGGHAGQPPVGMLPAEEVRRAIENSFASPIDRGKNGAQIENAVPRAARYGSPGDFASQAIPGAQPSIQDVEAGREQPLSRILDTVMRDSPGFPAPVPVRENEPAGIKPPAALGQSSPFGGSVQSGPTGGSASFAAAPSSAASQTAPVINATASGAAGGEDLRRQVEEWFERRTGSQEPTAAETAAPLSPAAQNTFNVTVQMAEAIPDEGELADRIARILIDQARRYGIEVE